MSKELRISVAINVPDDAFEQAQLLSKINPARITFAEALAKAVCVPVTVDARIVSPITRTKKAAALEPVAEPVVEETVVAHPHHKAA